MPLFDKQKCIKCGECCTKGIDCIFRPFENLPIKLDEECPLLSKPNEDNEKLCIVMCEYYRGAYSPHKHNILKLIVEYYKESGELDGTCNFPVELQEWKDRMNT
jgi:hypothetical protein